MKVSTVIPVYNRQELVKDALRSAQAQNVASHEIVVVDNCSTDATWDVVQEFARQDPRIRCFRNSENIGPVRNWRVGIEKAKGEYCHLLFSDDLIEPDFLSSTLNLFDDQTAFVMTGHKFLDSNGFRNPSTFPQKNVWTRDEILEAGIFGNTNGIQLLSPLSALFRRSELLNALVDDIANPLGVDFPGHGAGPDQLTFLLTAIHYPKVKCVNNHLVVMHAHDGSITIKSKDLTLPREWTRWYFVNQYWPQARERFRSVLWLTSKLNPNSKPVFEHINRELGGLPKISLILEYAIRRYFNRPRKPAPGSIHIQTEVTDKPTD